MFIKALGLEIFINSTDYSAYEYIKESESERELQIGKARIIISSKVNTPRNSFLIEI